MPIVQHQTVLALVAGLHEIVIDVLEPQGQLILAVQQIDQLHLIVLGGAQAGSARHLAIAAIGIALGTGHGPILGIAAVTRQGELQQMALGRGEHSRQCREGHPLAVDVVAEVFGSKREVEREKFTPTLAASHVEIGHAFVQPHRRAHAVEGEVLVAAIARRGVGGAIVQLPAPWQAVLHRGKPFPTADALSAFRLVGQRPFGQVPAEPSAGGSIVVGEVSPGAETSGEAEVGAEVVQGVAAVALRRGGDAAIGGTGVVGGLVVSRVGQAERLAAGQLQAVVVAVHAAGHQAVRTDVVDRA